MILSAILRNATVRVMRHFYPTTPKTPQTESFERDTYENGLLDGIALAMAEQDGMTQDVVFALERSREQTVEDIFDCIRHARVRRSEMKAVQ